MKDDRAQSQTDTNDVSADLALVSLLFLLIMHACIDEIDLCR